MFGPDDLLELIKLTKAVNTALEHLDRDRLERVDAALADVIPALEDFERSLNSEDWQDIETKSQVASDALESAARTFKQQSVDDQLMSTLAKRIKSARSWEYYESLKTDYRKLSPKIIEKFTELRSDVKRSLATKH